jgi:hypothetical protein
LNAKQVRKNNVGKSCLLEALWLYARRGSPNLITQLLEMRDEINRTRTLREETLEDQARNIKHLFYGRRDITEQVEPIRIGPMNLQDHTLSIAVKWYGQFEEGGVRKLRQVQPKEYDTVGNLISPSQYSFFGGPKEYDAVGDLIPGLGVQMGTQRIIDYPLDWNIRRFIQLGKFKEFRCIFISANGLSKAQIGESWDRITLTDLEKDVLTSLRIIAPEVERVNLVGSQEQERSNERVPKVKIAGLDDSLPLRSLGEGLNRMFGIALALVDAKDGMLLIDEVESGLHYSVQPDLWRLIFQVAHRLNVQVFATTHSWDCIKAFQVAAQEDSQEEGLLIRLEHKKGDIVATLFDEEETAISAREQIEVR